MDFSTLCHDPEQLARLRPAIDSRAARGEGYELPHCRMPEGCAPGWACVGFFRRPSGEYVMYWRPAVRYQGERRVLHLLFGQSLWTFGSFALLACRLRTLAAEVPPPRPAPAGGGMEAPPRIPPALHGPSAPLQPPAFQKRPSGLPAPEVLRRALGQRVLGQEAAVEAAAYYLGGHLSKCAPARPLSLLLYGPTGVGKSELARAVAPCLEQAGGEAWQPVWTELNTFTQPHAIHRLIGAPPGYVGYEDEPVLAAVRRNPRSVFLFDELDKAHPDVLTVLMSVLDQGRCCLNRVPQGGQRELDLRRCVLVFTANFDLSAPGRPLGFSAPPEPPEKTKAAAPDELAQRLFLENEAARRALVRQGVLREVAGRFGGIVGFQPLAPEAQRAILAQRAIALGAEYGLAITRVAPEAAAALLPTEEAFSIRSAIVLLEGRLAPLYQQAAARGAGTAYQLRLHRGTLSLSADGRAAG